MKQIVFNPILRRPLIQLGNAQVGRKLPIYADLLPAFVDVCKERIKSHHQNVIGICGRTSSGKSNLALDFAYQFDPYFTIPENYLITTSDLAKKLKRDPSTVSPINLFDECSITLNSGRHQSKESTDITSLFDIMRSWEQTSLLCTVKLRTINNRVREDHIDFLMTCGRSPLYGYSSRGFFTLYGKVELSPFSAAVYWQPIGWGIFTKIPEKINKIYQPYKAATQARYREYLIDRYLNEEDNVILEGLEV